MKIIQPKRKAQELDLMKLRAAQVEYQQALIKNQILLKKLKEQSQK